MTSETHENAPPVTYCANHPTRETGLRCNRCEKHICPSCAVRTPTGYRCKECVRGQTKVFDTAEPQDYVVAVIAGGLLSFLGSLVAAFIGFWIILLAPAAGTMIAEVVRTAVRRRRSRQLFQIATGAVALGSLLPVCVSLFALFAGGGLSFGLIIQGLYTFMVTSTFYYRLAGIRLRV